MGRGVAERDNGPSQRFPPPPSLRRLSECSSGVLGWRLAVEEGRKVGGTQVQVQRQVSPETT